MSSAPEEIYQSLPLPEYKVGWIIGKRGSYIKQLEKKSSALISISETTTFEHDIMWKFVHISGSGRAVDKAKKLLHIRMERYDPNAPRSAESEYYDELQDDGDAPISSLFRFDPTGGDSDYLRGGRGGRGRGGGALRSGPVASATPENYK